MPTGFHKGGVCRRCQEVYTGHYQTHRKNECKNPLEWGKKDKKTGLTHRQKQIWQMKEELDAAGKRKTHVQIAEELGIRKDTVANTLYAARARLGGLKDKRLLDLPRNKTPIQVYEYARDKLLNELVDRVKNKTSIKGIENDELISMLRGVSQGIAMEVEYSRGGSGHEGIRLNADERMFGKPEEQAYEVDEETESETDSQEGDESTHER